MSFVRVKKIKGNEYAYLVENSWSGQKNSRQKVKEYLGRIFSFPKGTESDFNVYQKISSLEEYVHKTQSKKILRDLIEWEFHRHRIDTTVFLFNDSTGEIVKGGKKVCIRLNQGVLCGPTYLRLLNFTPLIEADDTSEDPEKRGLKLARAFVDCGIEIPSYLFVSYFQKVLPQ